MAYFFEFYGLKMKEQSLATYPALHHFRNREFFFKNKADSIVN